MRLTCPNCEAQYEVPDDVIPQGGRDVQCSNCGDTWFQYHPDNVPPEVKTEDDIDTADSWDDTVSDTSPDTIEETYEDPTPERTRRELDPEVQDILRDEATRESEARAMERGGVETQPDLGLDDPGTGGDDELARRSREARNRMARLRGEPDEPEISAEDIDPASRRALLPDIEEINSSLRAGREAGAGTISAAAYPEGDPNQRGSGFRRGFLLVLMLTLLAVGIYVYAPMIADRVPATAGPLAIYVEMVDGARLWFDGQVRNLLLWLDSMSSSQSGY